MGILLYHSVSQVEPETCGNISEEGIQTLKVTPAKGRLPGKSKCIRSSWEGPRKSPAETHLAAATLSNERDLCGYLPRKLVIGRRG
jgi:hypothetical protein